MQNSVVDNKCSRRSECGDMFIVLCTFSEEVQSQGLLSEGKGEGREGGGGREKEGGRESEGNIRELKGN